MADKNNFESQVSYILGIASIVFAFVSPIAGLILGVMGITTSKTQNTSLTKKAERYSKVGIIISIVIFVLVIVAGTYIQLNGIGTFPQ